MKFNLFFVALKNIRRKSFRTAILILSLGLLIAILVFGASFVISVRSTIDKASDRLGADILVVPVGAREAAQEVLLETKTKTFYMDRDFVRRVSEIEGIEAVTYHTYLSTILGVCCDIPPAKIVAFSQDTDFILKNWLVESLGRRLELGEAIIGSRALENLDLLEVDSSVLFNLKFDFVGVLDDTGTGLDDAIFIAEENVPMILNAVDLGIDENMVSVIFARIKPGYNHEHVGWDIEEAIVETDIIERHTMGSKMIGVLTDINKIFLLTILLASLIATFLAWSVFSAIANERFKEVGIMRAIGARCSHVLKLFMMEVLILGVVGSILGIIGGTALYYGLSGSFSLIRELAATITPLEQMFIGIGGLVAGICICIGGAYSSMVFLRKQGPLNAIKEI